jgi:hypothetical protein
VGERGVLGYHSEVYEGSVAVDVERGGAGGVAVEYGEG